MDTAARVAGIADTPDPTAHPSRDIEAGSLYTRERTGSRASLPLASQRSQSRASGRGRGNSAAGQRPSFMVDHERSDVEHQVEVPEDDIPWGPQHPCFPHVNPHVPITSPLYQSTRIIRIKRDWLPAGDLAPSFSTLFPEILEAYISEESFKDLIITINEKLRVIFDPWGARAMFDAGMGLLTGWLWDDMGFSGVKKELIELERDIQVWSRANARASGVSIVPLRRTAYMTIDIQIPDPMLDELDEAANDGGRTTTNGRGRVNTGESLYSVVSTQLGDASRNPIAAVR